MKYINYILILICISFSACNDWLEIDPKSEAGADEMFTTAAGFRNALNGVYLEAASQKLYGEQLTWRFIDALGQVIESRDITSIKKANEYDYEYSSNETAINNIWSKSYNVILNCNYIIDKIHNSTASGFKENEKEMIEGEALAMRAMLHFDLLRLFADRYQESKDKLSIPYYKHKVLTPEPQLKASEVIKNIKDDLIAASLLTAKVDTIQDIVNNISSTTYRFGTRSRDFEFSHRGYRFNYYATLGLLARVCIYEGNKAEAYGYAKQIKDFKLFEFTSESDLSSSEDDRDVNLREGVLFGLHDIKLTENYGRFTNEAMYWHIYVKNAKALFEDDLSDFRFKYILKTENNKDYYSLINCSSDDSYVERDERPLIPLLRLSEMYYIMIEHLMDVNIGEAIDLMNELRISRGIKSELPENINKKDLMEELVKDAQKEFIGEGQVWYLFKRLNHDIKTGTQIIKAEDIKFTFPYPNAEIGL